MIKLSGLRVAAEMDASKYAAGMQQKVAADKAGIASSTDVAQSLARQDAQLGRSAGGLTKLSRQYIDGYSSAARFEQAIRQLGGAIDKGAIPLERVDTILDGIYRKYGLTANAAELMERGQVELAGAVTRANAALASQEIAADGAAMAMQRLGASNDNWRRRNLNYQLFDVAQMAALGQAPAMLLMQQGPQIAQLYAGEGGVKAALDDTRKSLTGLLRSFGTVGAVVAAGAAVAGVGIAALRSEINETAGATVSFGDVALGVWQMIRDGLVNIFGPAIDAVKGWFSTLWENIGAWAVDEFNNIARNLAQLVSEIELGTDVIAAYWKGSVEAAKTAWALLPGALGDIVFSTANNVIDGIESMINGAIDRLNSFIAKANEWLPEGWQNDPVGHIDFGGVGNPFAGQRAAFDSSMAGIRSNTDAAVAGAIGDHAGRMEAIAGWSPFQDLTTRAADNARAGLEAVEDAAGTAGDALKKAGEKGKSAFDKASEAMGFARDVVVGFVSDLRQGLKSGEGFFESFKNAALNALDKIIDKLLNNMLDALFQVGSAAGGLGGGGGIIGGLFNWLFNADGNAFQNGNVIPFARGGVVSRPTIFPMANGAGLMGEAGPEAIMPLKRGADGRLGVSAANNNQPQAMNVLISVVSRFDANGNFETKVESISKQQVAKAAPVILGQAKRQVVPAMAEYQFQRAGGDYR